MRASGAQAHINARLDIAKIFARARAVAQADARARARADAHAVTQTSETITQMRAQTWTDTRAGRLRTGDSGASKSKMY